MTPEWGLSTDYPMTAPNYAAKRSEAQGRRETRQESACKAESKTIGALSKP